MLGVIVATIAFFVLFHLYAWFRVVFFTLLGVLVVFISIVCSLSPRERTASRPQRSVVGVFLLGLLLGSWLDDDADDC